MTRELLIDAYNVIFAHPKFGPLVRRDNEAARREFLAFVAANRPQDGSQVYVVFDAHRDPTPTTEAGRAGRAYDRGVHVVFATETADTWIQERLRRASDARQITVVTSDREILATVQAHQAQVLRVSEFLQLRRRSRPRAATPEDGGSYMSRKELARWRKLFEERGDGDGDDPDQDAKEE